MSSTRGRPRARAHTRTHTHAYLYKRGADKFLARLGRKQATATKLGIYSTYSPRWSIHFLARYSNFCNSLKKKSEDCPSNHVSAAAMTYASNNKLRLFNFFSVHGRDGSPTGPDAENRVGDQDTGSPGRPVSSGLQVPCEPGHWRARTRPPWLPYRGVFPSKCPSIATAEIRNTPCWYFGLLEDNRWGGCRLDPKKSRPELFQRIFVLWICRAGWAPMPPFHWLLLYLRVIVI